MADPKKLRILKKMSAHLEGMAEYPDIKVYRGKTVVSAKEVEDCISILEAPRPGFSSLAGAGNVMSLAPWTLLLQGWPKDDKENPSDPAYIMEDIVRRRLGEIIDQPDTGALRTDPLFNLGGDIASLIIGEGVVRPPEDAASRLAMFYIPLIVEVTTSNR